MTTTSVELQSVNTLRVLAIDMANKANSGHPGLPMGAAPMAYVLWQRHLCHDPSDPTWMNRDRFVLSPGHGSMLLYSLLHLTGYDLSLDDLKQFRQWNSRTPGHPEFGMTPGVEATTGPLGQGAANAVGMAVAERMLAHRFNRPGFDLVDHHTFAIVSDGDLMEGISAEASSLAGHMGLGKLIYLYDSNDVTLDGPASFAFSTEDVAKRYEAYGWHVITVADGDHDLDGLHKAIEQAKAETARPSLIVVKTTIGFGSPNRAGTHKIHGSPLGDEEGKLAKRALGWPEDKTFHIPEAVTEHMHAGAARGTRDHEAWDKLFAAYAERFPQLATQWEATVAGKLQDGWDADLPRFTAGQAQATRAACGTVIQSIAQAVPWFVSGDADIGASTKTPIKDAPWFDARTGAGRNIHYGIREHAMAAIAAGMVYHGGVRPAISTFLTFVDYMRGAVRVASLSHLPVIYVFSHDSVAVGEDGPTHQPVEHVASLRAIPNLVVVRPADPNETTEAWRWAMTYQDGPAVIVTTRQKVEVLEQDKLGSAREGLPRGAYILKEPSSAPKAVIIASGSEVGLALGAQAQLEQDGIPVRVVSMPSWELFERQEQAYQENVLPDALPRVAVEAGVGFGWERWTGRHGRVVSIDRFGASAPGGLVMEQLGMTKQNVVKAVRELL